MRIGLITGEYPPMQGGVGAYTRVLAHTLLEQGHDVHVLTDVRAADDRLTMTNTVQQWHISILSEINRWVNTGRFDVVNLQYQTAAYGMSPWVHFIPSLIRSVPVVTTFHDLRYPYLFPKAGKLRDWIVMHLARTSRGVIATNPEDANRLKFHPHAALIPIGSNITEALPPDADLSQFREYVGAKPGDFLIAYFGFINRSKGIDVLLNCLAALRAENIPAKLVLIGGRTGASDPTNIAYANEIDTLIETLKLSDVVMWTGFVGDIEVAGLLSASDAVTLPFLDGASYRRGSLMAAIDQGCPIVTTTPQVIVEAFCDGENMVFATPGDSASLTAALRRLYYSPDLRQQLREGTRLLAQRFTWPQIAQETVEFFKTL